MPDRSVVPGVLGFIGLGNMGGPMCDRLLAAGHDVVAYDLVGDRLDAAVANGATAATSAQDCASRADVLLTSLPRPDHVERAMAGTDEQPGALAALRPGSLWIDLTTNRKDLVARLAAAAPAGVDVVDSPVTGAVDGARHGRLTLFLGGDPAPVARATSILEHLGTVIATGALGTGNVVKLVTNQLWFVAAAALGEGFAVGMSHGVELDTLYRAITESVGDSFVARHDAPSIFAGHYDPSFTVGLCLKDLGLLAELQDGVDASLPLTDAARAAFTEAGERYGPDVGELHVAKRLEDDTGLSFRLAGDWPAPWEVDE
ncbi:MAG: NAD(P)-dependent oxidoreductase [Ilumatobacter sp.]|nr:NAD(P)-dependent oxidoreductase [Ilumatobacter sp.]